MRSRSRIVLSVLGVALLGAITTARPVAAQTLTGTAGTLGTTTTTTGLADGDIFIGVQVTEGANLAAFDLARFFNKAACDCDTPVFIYYTLTASGFAKRAVVPQGTVSFWVGSSCDQVLLRPAYCQQLGVVVGPGQTAGQGMQQIATFMANGRATIPTTARVISANSTLATTSVDGGTTTSGAMPNPDCTSTVNGFNQTLWAVFDYGADGTVDYAASTTVNVDLVPPPQPTNIKVAAADEAINLTWTPIDYSITMDLQGYQIFCQRAQGFQVFPKDTFGSAVRTCPGVGSLGVDGGIDMNGVAGLDPLFACSPLLNRTVDSFRVKVLQNNIFYGATVVAIDNSGNALPTTLAGENFAMPQKTTTFWDAYKDGNVTNGSGGTMGTATPGKATGGYCAVANGGDWTTGLGVGAGVLALGAAIARARRRRS